MSLSISLCHDSRAGSRFLSGAGKTSSVASKMRANCPENYAFSLWLQQRAFLRRWEGRDLRYNGEDLWLFGDYLEPWLGKIKKMGRRKGWKVPWDAQDRWKRRVERDQWKGGRHDQGGIQQLLEEGFSPSLSPTSYWFFPPPQFCLCLRVRRLQVPQLEVMDVLFFEQQSWRSQFPGTLLGACIGLPGI